MTLWVCRAGGNGEYENYFLEKKTIAITWAGLIADITGCDTKDKLKEVLWEIYPDEKKNTIANYAGQLFPFVNTMQIGEKVLLPGKIKPGIYYIGTIKGDCIFSPGQTSYRHTREVVWDTKVIERKNLDADIKSSLNAYLTIFSLNKEMESRIFGKKIAVSPISKEQDAETSEEETNLEFDAMEQIRTKIIQKFKGYDMQKVIDSIFKAKGYSTFVPTGPGKGIDILASNGPLGFGGTKICIQVKTEDNPIDRSVFLELIGTMKNVGADYGLFVSWNGFRTSLESEMRDRFFSIKFWDHKDIVREFLENYDKLEDWIRARVSLKKIWVIDNQIEPE